MAEGAKGLPQQAAKSEAKPVSPLKKGERDFGERVFTTQDRWRSHKRRPLTEVSQAIDMPERFAGKILDSVIDNMPDYIPQNLKQRLRDTHPAPIYATSVISDKRFFEDDPQFELKYKYPNDIVEKDKPFYRRGLKVLDEVLMDSLDADIRQKLISKHLLFRPINAINEKLARIAPMGYRETRSEVQDLIGDERIFEQVRRGLILTMLSGDNSYGKNALREAGYGSISEFIVDVGRSGISTEMMQPGIDRTQILKNAEHSTASSVEQQTASLRERLRGFFSRGGRVRWENPGIVDISMPTLSIITSGVAVYGLDMLVDGFSSGNALGVLQAVAIVATGLFGSLEVANIPRTIIHETCHYLSQGIDHAGLRRTREVSTESPKQQAVK